MKIIVANKEDYINFNARLKDNMKTFELSNDTKDYIIHRVKLSDETKDVSLIDSCINNLLDEQYEKRNYITISEIEESESLISKLDNEQCKILNAYAEVKNYNIQNLNEIKELISSIDDYQILNVHNLRETGILIAQKCSEYKISIDSIPYFNFEKLAENYLWDHNIKQQFSSYGLLVNTKDILENDLVMQKIPDGKILKLEVVNKKEYQESNIYGKCIIYMPTTEKELQEKFKKIGLDYNNLDVQDSHVTKCSIVNSFDNELADKFNTMMENMITKFSDENGYTTPFQEIQFLYDEIKKFDNTMMTKFLALVETREYYTNYIHDLVTIAKETKNYDLLPDVKNLNDMGEYLVSETGHFDDISFLQDYINYYKLAKDYTREGNVYAGEFTNYGYLMKKEFIQEEEKQGEKEEEFE